MMKSERPSTLSEKLSAIVIASGTGILQKRDPMSLECNGGLITLKKAGLSIF